MILVLLLWQLLSTIAIYLIFQRLRKAENELVIFSLLTKRGGRDSLCEKLKSNGITILQNTTHSDYLKCQTSRTNFELVFKCKLLWKEMLVGGWEVEGGHLPEELSEVKQCLLSKNLMLPPKFLSNTTIT